MHESGTSLKLLGGSRLAIVFDRLKKTEEFFDHGGFGGGEVVRFRGSGGECGDDRALLEHW